MIKIYRYNQYKNHVEIMLSAPGGMRGKPIFDNGNVATRVMPTVSVSSAFWQQVIEDSDLVKGGYVSCIQVIKDDEDEVKKPEVEYTPIEDVTTLSQAVDYVADNYGEKAHTINEALKVAHKNGVDFPNLKKK